MHPPPTHPTPHTLPCSNAANALSEDNSLLSVPVWRNPWLLVAMAVSLGLHALILYVPFLAGASRACVCGGGVRGGGARLGVWVGGWVGGVCAMGVCPQHPPPPPPTHTDIFSIVPLTGSEWALVLAYSLPVILIDEVLKFIGRTWVNAGERGHAALEARAKEE